jgi:hypothetical protein
MGIIQKKGLSKLKDRRENHKLIQLFKMKKGLNSGILVNFDS